MFSVFLQDKVRNVSNKNELLTIYSFLLKIGQKQTEFRRKMKIITIIQIITYASNSFKYF